jgi:outer membrane protein assembly factor BamB/tetratricopeptide (TPR) repeat protein
MRRLVALDLETGALLWRHDDEFLAAHPASDPLRTLSISGAPVVRGDRLYAGAVASEGTFHSHVVAIDRLTGDLVYATRVSNGQQELNLFGRQLQECMPMPLTEVEGILYYGTNLGIVAAVDALLGTPIWAAAYATEKIPSTFYWFEAPRRWPRFANSPPLVSGDTVVVLPTDSTHLLALDRRSGEILFRVPPRVFPGDGPLDLQTLHAVDAERAYVGGPGGVVALWLVRDPARHAEPGEIAWTTWFSSGDTGAGRGFLARDALWVPTFNAIYRIDPPSGKGRSAPERGGRDGGIHVHLVWGDGVLVTAGHDARDARADRGVVSARFDRESVLKQATERARQHPDEPLPLLDAADIHLAAGEVGPAVDLFLRAKALAEARGAAAAARRAELGLHRALLRRAHESLGAARAFERAEGEFDAALRVAPDDGARLRARCDLELALAGAGEDAARKWRARNLRALEREHGDEPDPLSGRPVRGWALLRLAELQVDEGSPRRALAVLQQLLESDPDGEDGRQASRRIRKLVEEHREAYEPYEKRAQKLFETALAKGDLEALDRGLRIYASAEAAGPAALELARRQIRARDATGAARTLQAFLAEHPLSPRAAEALLLMVEALHGRGSHGPAYAALLRLRARHGDALLARADGSKAPARAIADEWLKQEPYASLARSARRRDLPPKLRLLFEQEFPNDLTPEVPDLLGTIPEALRGAVVLKAGTRIRVLDGERGTERYALDLGLDQPRGPIVLAGDRLYAATESFVHVYDASSGRALQRRPVPDRGRALSLAEHKGQVFLLYRERGVLGQAGLAALHPADGSLLWSRLMPAGALDPPGASYQVIAHEDRLLLFSTQPVEAWVLDPTSGAVENRIALETSPGAERRLDPILLPGGRVLLGMVTRQQGPGFQYRSATTVVLIDPAAEGDAAVVWKYRSRADEDRALRHLNVVGEYVAVVDDTRGAAVLEIETGREVKSVSRLDVPGAPDEDRYLDEPQPRHDSLLLVLTPTTSDAPARLSAYDLPDLRLRYSVELTESSREMPRLVDAQGVLVLSVGPRRGRVGKPRIRLLDPLSGDLLDELALPRGDVNWTIAKVQNGVLLVTTNTNTVYAFGPR